MNTKILQFTAGRGPTECAWVVAKVIKIFLKQVAEILYRFLKGVISNRNTKRNHINKNEGN